MFHSGAYALSLFLISLSLHTSSIVCHVIEGSLIAPPDAPAGWFQQTRIHVDGSSYIGFVRPDGSFEVSGLPSGGSYLVEVINNVYFFQSARVDISSKGRIRARHVNAPQPNAVKELNYPLQLSSNGKAVYFKTREQLRTIDLLLNANVLYILVPLLIMMALTRVVNQSDPELRKEMQQLGRLNSQQSLPDMGELLSSVSLFGGGGDQKGSKRRRNEEGRSAASISGAASADNGGSMPTAGGRKSTKRRN